MSTPPQGHSGSSAPPFRIAPQLHQILYKRPGRDKLDERPEEVLPEPPYPQRPNAKEMTHKEYLKLNGVRMWKTWGAPYFRSRYPANRNSLRPIIPYLFTDWKCNLDCHYCWSYDNKVKGVQVSATAGGDTASAAAESQALPNTGLSLLGVVVVGGALVAGGLLLRRREQRKS